MATGNGGTAYDLSLFETKRAELVALKLNKKEQKQSNKRARLQRFFNAVAYLAVAIAALFVIGFLITSNVRLTEMNSQISESKARLSELQSEQIRLQSELASKTSIANVNDYARQNGMTAADGSQITYITVSGSDTVTVAADSGNWLSKAIDAIVGFFS